MKDLALRLAALDPDASAALRIIARFDRLTSTRTGLPTIVREAAVLAGCPVRLVDKDRHLLVRADPDPTAAPDAVPSAGAVPSTGAVPSPGVAVDVSWPSAPLPGEGAARIWLERPGPASPVEAVTLERAAAAAAAVLRRTLGVPARPAAGDSGCADPACVDLILDGAVPETDRLRAARQLGLAPAALARAVAVHDAGPYLEPVPAPQPAPYRARRAGIGPAVAVPDLPSSWAAARTALRFTAEGTPADPGPRLVAHEELGGLVLLAAAVGPATGPVPDVAALDAVAATAPWVLATLDAIAGAGSLRAAAGALRVHHSTLQDRLAALEHQLGWAVREPAGRLRLQMALTLRRLHRNPNPPDGVVRLFGAAPGGPGS